VYGLGAAAQDGGVAGLDAERGGLQRDVGARLVDDADDAQGHAHLAHLDTGGAVYEVGNGADRVGQLDHLAQAFEHTVELPLGKRQAVEHGCVQSAAAAVFNITGIGGENGVVGRRQLGANGGQGGVLVAGAGARHGAGSGTGLVAQVFHVSGNVHRRIRTSVRDGASIQVLRSTRSLQKGQRGR